MQNTIPIIAIDGTAGSGKGTLAKRLAQHLEYGHLDTGKLYRAVGYLATVHGTDTADETAMVGLVDYITAEVLANPILTTNSMGNMASQVVSRMPAVRTALLGYQRTFPMLCVQRGQLGAVVDGRDIGSVIFPDAPVKLFVTADVQVRAKRRFAELCSHTPAVQFDTVLSDIKTRDTRDMTAAVGRLVQTPDSIFIDTTHMDVDRMLQNALSHVKKVYKIV